MRIGINVLVLLCTRKWLSIFHETSNWFSKRCKFCKLFYPSLYSRLHWQAHILKANPSEPYSNKQPGVTYFAYCKDSDGLFRMVPFICLHWMMQLIGSEWPGGAEGRSLVKWASSYCSTALTCAVNLRFVSLRRCCKAHRKQRRITQGLICCWVLYFWNK